ncbi:unnamed protein product [Leptidea sinapis]|uniref:Uncharacterized protein n=1 Tax=Leptidea sinapis TaxID=189913 RepID=A0A5E4QEJ5_9NEOP|nr:unnamed protein product [Leptidea sinapis]
MKYLHIFIIVLVLSMCFAAPGEGDKGGFKGCKGDKDSSSDSSDSKSSESSSSEEHPKGKGDGGHSNDKGKKY